MKKNAPRKTVQYAGKFVGNERGFGFVLREEGVDIFIPPHATGGAIHGDEVLCSLEPDRKPANKGRAEKNNESPLQSGTIVKVTRREPMVGTFFMDGRHGLVKPLENKIPYIFSVPPKSIARLSLADGHRVVFSVDKKLNPDAGVVSCFIMEIIGHINDPGVDVLTLVRRANVPYEFSEEAMAEAAALPSEVGEDEIAGRLDLRNEFIFTIDGEDTKDIDDAVSFAKTDAGYRLGVHIADVSHYVREDSALDIAAFNRGTSIYLADRVIPMLPHKLSSGICSLFPDVDRLAISCFMTVDENGDVTDYEIAKSVIHSKKRMTYQEVQDALDIGEDKLLNQMNDLREILCNKRENRGALDFDIPEAKIRVDEAGRVISIEPYPRNHATQIIEEFMILCNETIASHFLKLNIAIPFRTHEAPSREKLATLGVTGTTALRNMLNAARNTPQGYAVSQLILRAMPQAHYTTDNPTHFGLASKAYCHFTSPIRRYADLQVHRCLEMPSENLSEICTQASHTERAAEALEREVAELKKVQFMADKVRQTFDAVVSGLVPWGLYVMLPNTVEGLIPEANLSRHGYRFNKQRDIYESRKNPHLRRGSAIKVRLADANEDERKLTFVLAY